MIERTIEVSSRGDSLLARTINDSNTNTNLLAINPEGEYVPNKTFLYLAKERGLNLRQDRYNM